MQFFTNNLLWLKKQYNFTQEDLAEKLQVSRQSISKWERGEAFPDIINLAQISKVYDVSIDDLINKDLSILNNNDQETDSDKIPETADEVNVGKIIPSVNPIAANPITVKAAHEKEKKNATFGRAGKIFSVIMIFVLSVSTMVLAIKYFKLNHKPEDNDYTKIIFSDPDITQLKINPKFNIEICLSPTDNYLVQYPTLYDFTVIDGVGTINRNELSIDYFDRKITDLIKIFVPADNKLTDIILEPNDDALSEEINVSIKGLSLPKCDVKMITTKHINFRCKLEISDCSFSELNLGQSLSYMSIKNTSLAFFSATDCYVKMEKVDVFNDFKYEGHDLDISESNIGCDLNAVTTNGDIGIKTSNITGNFNAVVGNGDIRVDDVSVNIANIQSSTGGLYLKFNKLLELNVASRGILCLDLSLPQKEEAYCLRLKHSPANYNSRKQITVGNTYYDLSDNKDRQFGNGSIAINLEYDSCDSVVRFA